MTQSVSTHRRISIATPVIYVLLFSYFVLVVFPMIWVAYTSLKPDKDVFAHPFSPPALNDIHWSNYPNAWTRAHFGQYFFNSLTLTISTVVGTMFLSSMAAYALARFAFPGSKAIFFYFLAGLMIPLQLAIIPLFFQLKWMHLLDTRTGLLFCYLAFGMPFAIFILTAFFRSLPASLHEAALIDGAGEFGAFFRIMLPLARPGLITVAIFAFLGTWNEYFMAFMFLNGEDSERLRTLPLGLANVTIVSQYRSDWGMAFAGLVLMMAPTLLIYIALQRYITSGITAGAVKG
ncbi:MAG TPA: carbohydrate ABC transporter permease [Tepidisphaeraceae bacterium]|jgi:ABC-type glycerol-3-phosphate transport system permease component|nr:carbohydrate ABC transporter permease [Tepidisphaeraceae bacterium]